MSEMANERPVVYMDKERVDINMDNKRLVAYLEKLRGDLPLLLEQRQALLDRHGGQESATDAMYLNEVMNASDICGTVIPLLYVLMDNLILWFGRDDGRLFQLNRLRCTDGMIIFELGEHYMSLGPKKQTE